MSTKSNAPIAAKFHHNSNLNRTFIFPARKEDRESQKRMAKELQVKLSRYIDPAITGYVKGRGLISAVLQISKMREAGKFILKADISGAFFDVCPLRMSKLLRRSGLDPSKYVVKSVWSSGREIQVRGLPQGFSTSPILWALYISPIAKRLRRKFGPNVLLYADDVWIAVSNEAEAGAAKEFLQECLSKQAYFKTAPKLNEMKVRVCTPSTRMKALGVAFCPSGRLLPDSRNSARHFNATYRTTDLFKKAASKGDGRSVKRGDSSSSRREQSATEGMAKTWAMKCGPAYFGSFRACSTLPVAEQGYRKEVLRGLNQNLDLVNALYLRQMTGEAGFSQLLDELWCRFIRFHPCESLTSFFAGVVKVQGLCERKAAKVLYLNELRLIDDWSFFEETIGKDHLKGIFLSRRKIQQFLRGHAAAKMIDLMYGQRIWSSHVIKVIGTHIFPVVENLGYLRLFVEFLDEGVLNRKQFQRCIRIFAEKRISDDFIVVEAIAMDVLGIDKKAFEFRRQRMKICLQNSSRDEILRGCSKSSASLFFENPAFRSICGGCP